MRHLEFFSSCVENNFRFLKVGARNNQERDPFFKYAGYNYNYI